MPYDKSYQNSFYNKIKDKRVDIEEVDEYWEKDTDLGPLDPSWWKKRTNIKKVKVGELLVDTRTGLYWLVVGINAVAILVIRTDISLYEPRWVRAITASDWEFWKRDIMDVFGETLWLLFGGFYLFWHLVLVLR